MKFNLSYIYIFVFLFSCTQDMKIIKKISKVSEPTYSSKGFALIYEDSIFESKIVNKKLNNDQNYVLHPFLKKKLRYKKIEWFFFGKMMQFLTKNLKKIERKLKKMGENVWKNKFNKFTKKSRSFSDFLM